MATKSKPKKHGARSARARAVWAAGGAKSFAELGRKVGLSTQGARNAVNAMERVGKAKGEAEESGADE